jgi:hypothetical protein
MAVVEVIMAVVEVIMAVVVEAILGVNNFFPND